MQYLAYVKSTCFTGRIPARASFSTKVNQMKQLGIQLSDLDLHTQKQKGQLILIVYGEKELEIMQKEKNDL